MMFLGIFILVLAYLIGSLNFSIVFSKIFRLRDIRGLGSGNAGLTNSLRVCGVSFSLLVFFGDFIKGLFAVFAGKFLFSCFNSNLYEDYYIAALSLISFFCCIGHIFPCFFGFRGGKGILTAWACSLLIDWRIFLSLIVIFLVVLIISRIISLSSLISALFYPFLFLIFLPKIPEISYWISFLISLVLSTIVIVKHRGNIRRILAGKEKKISVKR